MDKPLVSICIPAYNHENYIESCIDSICAQTYENIELIICDDCSNDGTFSIIEKRLENLTREFTRVFFWKNEVNQGVVQNCNALICKSTGKYIKLLASDDMLCENAISELVEYLENYLNVDAVFANGYVCSETDVFPCANRGTYKLYYKKNPLKGIDNLSQRLYEGNVILAPSVMIRANVFDRIGPFDTTACFEDWEYWIRLALNGRIEYLDKVCVFYRVTSGSMSHYSATDAGRRKLETMVESIIKVLDKYAVGYELNYAKASVKVFSGCLQLAIDTCDEELIDNMLKLTIERGTHFDFTTKMKYCAYRMGVLRFIQRIKRRLGLETTEIIK